MGGDTNLSVEIRRLEMELEQARIALDTARYNEAHWKECARIADEKLSAYIKSDKRKK